MNEPPAAASPDHLPVLKTAKLFIGGKFPRTESGRTLAFQNADSVLISNYSRASKKDLRDAVTAARKALPGWSGATAYLRGQILYRLAEMLESRARALTGDLETGAGLSGAEARAEVEAAIDRLVYLAGWPDKLPQVFGSVNPVAGPYFNVSSPEPVGVVAAFAPDSPSLLAAAALIGNVLAAGNTCVLMASERFPLPALSLAEAIAVSDIPGGVVNILTGLRAELAPAAADHRDIDAIVDATGNPDLSAILQAGAAVNLKRVSNFENDTDWTNSDVSSGPWRLTELMETRTVWHPASA